MYRDDVRALILSYLIGASWCHHRRVSIFCSLVDESETDRHEGCEKGGSHSSTEENAE